jgi:hypothetical protein
MSSQGCCSEFKRLCFHFGDPHPKEDSDICVNDILRRRPYDGVPEHGDMMQRVTKILFLSPVRNLNSAEPRRLAKILNLQIPDAWQDMLERGVDHNIEVNCSNPAPPRPTGKGATRSSCGRRATFRNAGRGLSPARATTRR